MVAKDQGSVTLPIRIVQRLDEFLKSEKAKDMGYASRPTVVLPLLRGFLDEHHPISAESTTSKIEIIGVLDHKIILQDSIAGAVIVDIDAENRLMCYSCKDEDPHDNKWVRFCLKEKSLWKELKKRGVSIVKPRTIDKDEIAIGHN